MQGGGWKRGGQGGTDLSAAAFLGFCFFFQLLLKSKNTTVLLSFSVLLGKGLDFPGSASGLKKKNQKTHLPMQETQKTWVRSLGQEDPLEEGMATHSRILAWGIPWMEEPGRLQSIGSQTVGYD